MPYTLDGNCVKKKDTGETVKCHESREEALAHLRALDANVNDSIVNMSLRITKASYNKSEDNPRRWTAIDSDVDADLYQEKMSLELYQDFARRIKNNEPVPEAFKSVICEDSWCGGMPYLSIAHYKAGSGGNNVPGAVEEVFIDGNRLKSKGTLSDTPLGRAVFDSLVEDLYKKKSGDANHLPVRISIGFLDLEHKHQAGAGNPEFTFERKNPGEICPLCAQGVGGKIYTKGQLVHLAMTRVPVNPRTEMNVERSMEIETKKQDAESIVGSLANDLEEKSIAGDVLVVRAEGGNAPQEDMGECEECYNPNTGVYDQACVDAHMQKYVGKPRDDGTVKSRALLDAVAKSLKNYESNGQLPVVEESMDANVTAPVAEKGVLGIPEKPFNYAGIDGNGNNNIPNPVKAKDESAGEDDGSGDEMEKAFTALRGMVKSHASVEDVNKAFAALGTVVENAYAQKSVNPSGGVDLAAIAEIVRSAVAPLQVKLSELEGRISNGTVTSKDVVKSKALTLSGYPRPEDMIQRAAPQQPKRVLTQIEQIALRSTGAIRE